MYKTAPVVLPVLLLLSVWLLFTPANDSHLPATHDTPWLWAHVLMGKVFLGMVLLAVGQAGVVLLQTRRPISAAFQYTSAEVLDVQIWQWMILALIFHSLMLISGAVWAQDAWGRYWAWDPLETSAFLTWLALATALHIRRAWRVTPAVGAVMVLGIFILAFLTFFGIPFLSQAPHQGAI